VLGVAVDIADEQIEDNVVEEVETIARAVLTGADRGEEIRKLRTVETDAAVPFVLAVRRKAQRLAEIFLMEAQDARRPDPAIVTLDEEIPAVLGLPHPHVGRREAARPGEAQTEGLILHHAAIMR